MWLFISPRKELVGESQMAMQPIVDSNPRIDDFKELAHWTAYHNLDTILQPTLQALENGGYDYKLDRYLEKRLDYNKFIKSILQIDYSKSGGFQFLLVQFDTFLVSNVSSERMKERGIGYEAFIEMRETILLQLCLCLLYMHLNFQFHRKVPKNPYDISMCQTSHDRFKINTFEYALVDLLKTKELKYPTTKNEKMFYKTHYQHKNYQKMMGIVDTRINKLDIEYVHKLFSEHSIDNFEKELITFIRKTEGITLGVPSLEIQFATRAPSSSSASKSPKEKKQYQQVDVVAIVDDVINVGNWDDMRRISDGPYAVHEGYIHGQFQDGSQETASTLTASQDSLKVTRGVKSRETNTPLKRRENVTFNEMKENSNSAKRNRTKPDNYEPPERMEHSSSAKRNRTKPDNYEPPERMEHSSSAKRNRTKPEYYEPPERMEHSSSAKRNRTKPEYYEPWNTGEKKGANDRKGSTMNPNPRTLSGWQRHKWDIDETEALMKGMKRHRRDWTAILNDPEFDILNANGRTNINIKDRARNLENKGATLENFRSLFF